jgi:heme/copper-type cytochrome/quinol oxidase subunit 2
MKKIIAIVTILIPSKALALDNTIKGVVGQQKCQDGNCGFEELIQLVNAILQWAMIAVTSTATIMFVYAGFLYITAQGDTNQIKKAHNIFKVVAIGFVIIIVAFILVRELLKKLGVVDGLEQFAS